MRLISIILLTLAFSMPSEAIVNSPIQSFSNYTSGFEENKGQVFGDDAPKVKYFCKKGELTMFLLGSGIAYQFNKTITPAGFKPISKFSTPAEVAVFERLSKEIKTETYRMDLVLIGADPNATVIHEDQKEDYTHYYNYGILDVHNFGKVTYKNVYENIDWVIYISNGDVKYDFVVHPGGNPAMIKLKANYTEGIEKNSDGSISLLNRMGKIIEKSPVSFQEGKKIHTEFRLERNQISFDIAEYDKSKTLTIDPFIRWATYYGGTNVDYVQAMTMRVGGGTIAGNMFIAGYTSSTTAISAGGAHQTNFATGGTYDAFIVAIQRNGTRSGATYYGGTGNDYGWGCAREELPGTFGNLNNYYLVGQTSSTTGISGTIGFGGYTSHQTTNAGGGATDAFLVKFNTNGQRLYGTFYGGTGGESGFGIATDGVTGACYMTGSASSTNVISSAGAHQTSNGGSGDAFLVKFNNLGARQWGTFYGGSASDIGQAVDVDKSGNVFLAGQTASSSAISASGHQASLSGSTDAFLVKFTPAGTRLWGTYYGGSNGEWGYACRVDTLKNVFLGGKTTSTSAISTAGSFQTTIGGSEDGYLVKFDSTGARLWGTYYGGSGDDDITGCSTYYNGDVFIGGTTNSNSSIASGGFKNSLDGATDAYVAKLNSTGTTRSWGSYFGGNATDNGTGIAAEVSGGVVAFCGSTSSNSGVSTAASTGAHQSTYGGGTSDGFLVRICDSCVTPSVTITHNIANDTLCSGATITFTATVTNGGTNPQYDWYRNNTQVFVFTPTYTSNNFTLSTDTVWCIVTSNAANTTTPTDTSNRLGLTVLGYSTPTFAPLQFRACPGDTFFFPSNKSRTPSLAPRNFENRLGTYGVYIDTVKIAGSQCDSIYRFTVAIANPATNIFPRACPNDTVYGVSNLGKKFKMPATGTYTYPLRDTIYNGSSLGCDSIVNIYAQRITAFTNNRPLITVCSNDTIVVGTKKYVMPAGLYTPPPAGLGTLKDTIKSVLGCDSIWISQPARVGRAYDTTYIATICRGQSFTIGTNVYKDPGDFIINDLTAGGCDSITRLTLTVIEKTTAPTVYGITCPTRPFVYKSKSYTTATSFNDTLRTVGGCDSIITPVVVTLAANSTGDIYHTVCSNKLFKFNGMTPDTTGNYYDTIPNNSNCDSVLTLHLVVVKTSSSILTDSLCYNGSYRFGNRVLNAAGTYYDTIRNAAGCDSFIQLNLGKRAQKPFSIVKSANTLVGTIGFSYYQWYRNSAIILYENSNVHTPSLSGIYQLKAKDVNDCYYSSNDINFAASSIIGANELDFIVYPIPTNDLIYIQTKTLLDKEISIQVYSVDGKEIVSKWNRVSNNLMSFSTAQLSKGVYFVELKRNERVEKKKFIVE